MIRPGDIVKLKRSFFRWAGDSHKNILLRVLAIEERKQIRSEFTGKIIGYSCLVKVQPKNGGKVFCISTLWLRFIRRGRLLPEHGQAISEAVELEQFAFDENDQMRLSVRELPTEEKINLARRLVEKLNESNVGQQQPKKKKKRRERPKREKSEEQSIDFWKDSVWEMLRNRNS